MPVTTIPITPPMLWFDNSTKDSFEGKLQRASAFYEEKYGIKPTRCIINQTEFNLLVTDFRNNPLTVKVEGSERITELTVCGIEVTGAIYIRPNNFWLNPIKVRSSIVSIK